MAHPAWLSNKPLLELPPIIQVFEGSQEQDPDIKKAFVEAHPEDPMPMSVEKIKALRSYIADAFIIDDDILEKLTPRDLQFLRFVRCKHFASFENMAMRHILNKVRGGSYQNDMTHKKMELTRILENKEAQWETSKIIDGKPVFKLSDITEFSSINQKHPAVIYGDKCTAENLKNAHEISTMLNEVCNKKTMQKHVIPGMDADIYKYFAGQDHILDGIRVNDGGVSIALRARLLQDIKLRLFLDAAELKAQTSFYACNEHAEELAARYTDPQGILSEFSGFLDGELLGRELESLGRFNPGLIARLDIIADDPVKLRAALDKADFWNNMSPDLKNFFNLGSEAYWRKVFKEAADATAARAQGMQDLHISDCQARGIRPVYEVPWEYLWRGSHESLIHNNTERYAATLRCVRWADEEGAKQFIVQVCHIVFPAFVEELLWTACEIGMACFYF